jgi:hypothetical protein
MNIKRIYNLPCFFLVKYILLYILLFLILGKYDLSYCTSSEAFNFKSYQVLLNKLPNIIRRASCEYKNLIIMRVKDNIKVVVE